jgi:polar amino acid transport system substrate-binding protein
MMRWRPFLVILCVSALIVIGAALSNYRHQNGRVLHVATSPDYCPYEFVDPTGSNELIGFDIDVIHAIAQKLDDTPIVFDSMPFNQLMLSLRSQDVDVAIAALTPTAERQKVVNFSTVYHEEKSLIISAASTPIQHLSDLQGKQIGVRPGTVHEHAALTVPNSEVIGFDNTDTLVRAIQAKEIDAAILDEAIAQHHLRRRSKLNMLRLDNDKEAGVAIALPKRSPLRGPINQAIREMKTNGTLNELALKWFDEYMCPTNTAP